MEIMHINLILTIGSILWAVRFTKRLRPRQDFWFRFLCFFTISSLFLNVFTSNFKYIFLITNHIIYDKVNNSSTHIIKIISLISYVNIRTWINACANNTKTKMKVKNCQQTRNKQKYTHSTRWQSYKQRCFTSSINTYYR
jgi:hypothetical protein